MASGGDAETGSASDAAQPGKAKERDRSHTKEQQADVL